MKQFFLILTIYLATILHEVLDKALQLLENFIYDNLERMDDAKR